MYDFLFVRQKLYTEKHILLKLFQLMRDLVRHGMISHSQGHVTVTYKVKRECHGVDLCLYDFVPYKLVKTMTNHQFICTITRDRVSHVQSHATVT